jgi:hypothetical protein
LAIPPRTSQKPEGPTLAPTGTEAHLVELRSTAGSCFGRFIGLLLFVELTGIGIQMSQGRMPIPTCGWLLLSEQTAPADYRVSRSWWPMGIRLSQLNEGPTLAPTGTEAHLVELRSTAGSCFGRFMSWSSITMVATLPGRRSLVEHPPAAARRAAIGMNIALASPNELLSGRRPSQE